MHSCRGTTLIELLLAAVILTGVVITLSAVFPKISKSVSTNQQRLIAGNLASVQIELFKSQSYASIDPTDPSFFSSATLACDCRADDFSLMPSTSTSVGGTTYMVKSCIHNVIPNASSAWSSQCPGADTGYKIIRSRVFWTKGVATYTADQQILKSRD